MRRYRKTYHDPEPIGTSYLCALGPLTFGLSRGLLQMHVSWNHHLNPHLGL